MQNTMNQNSVFDQLFLIILPCIVVGFAGLGMYLRTCKSMPVMPVKSAVYPVRTQFIISEQPQPKVIAVEKNLPAPEKKAIERKTKTVDLTENIHLTKRVEQVQEEQVPQNAPKVRKVYGLRKVYSKGLGSGGSLSDAVVGKLGNTMNAPFDTFTATEEEIKGRVISTATVTSAPKFRKVVKPSYTPEMLASKTEGVVKVKVLIDIDGKVKKASVLNDIGFDSGSQAVKAVLEMEFVPALYGEEPVAVWIIIPIRFVLIS